MGVVLAPVGREPMDACDGSPSALPSGRGWSAVSVVRARLGCGSRVFLCSRPHAGRTSPGPGPWRECETPHPARGAGGAVAPGARCASGCGSPGASRSSGGGPRAPALVRAWPRRVASRRHASHASPRWRGGTARSPSPTTAPSARSTTGRRLLPGGATHARRGAGRGASLAWRARGSCRDRECETGGCAKVASPMRSCQPIRLTVKRATRDGVAGSDASGRDSLTGS